MGMIDRDPRGGMEQMDHVIEEARKYRNWEIERTPWPPRRWPTLGLGNLQRRWMPSSVPTRRRKTDSLVKQADVALLSAHAISTWATCSADWNIVRGTEKALSAHGLECAAAGYYARDSAICTRNLAEAQRRSRQRSSCARTISPNSRGLGAAGQPRARRARCSAVLGGDIEAINDMESTLANAEAVGDDYTVAFIAQALGEAYTQLDDFERAKRYLNTALDYYRRNDMRPYLARALQSLVYWYEQQDRGAEAEQARAEASRLMKSCPATGSSTQRLVTRHQRASAGQFSRAPKGSRHMDCPVCWMLGRGLVGAPE